MIYDRYYYSKLNNREKKAYKKIYAAMQNHESSVTINGFVETDIPKLMSAINLDNPHLFYVDFRYGFQSDLFSQTIILKYIYFILMKINLYMLLQVIRNIKISSLIREIINVLQ